MNDILNEIKRDFANIPIGHFMRIEQEYGFDVWVYRLDDSFGVAVDVAADMMISEKFATARLYTMDQNIGGEQHRFLSLENSAELLRNEFAVICAQFVDVGPEGLWRKSLCEDPSAWWGRWKDLLGNSVREKTTHGVLGELISYLTLLRRGDNPQWRGPDKSSHDLETETVDYEVKSTISRYGNTVTVSGQYQLEIPTGKVLKLLFLRFEEVASGGEFSINTLVDNLIKEGVDKSELEKKLRKEGFEEGCSARKHEFVLHDGILEYLVDENFPRITPASFVHGKMPGSIVQLTYQVDLTAIKYNRFNS